uniref:Uncharacterized protein n=1 Tax=Panagrolaimus sp. JU765 TaxID=591449 RepID=A0AC34PZZ8_9BILA
MNEPPKKTLRLSSTSNDEKQVKTKTKCFFERLVPTPRSLIYSTDPSEGLSLNEVYDLLMEQLDKLTKLGRKGGEFIVEQTKERLSQSPVKNKQSPVKLPLKIDDSNVEEQEEGREEVDLTNEPGPSTKNWQIPPDQLEDDQHHDRFSGKLCGYVRNLRSRPMKPKRGFTVLPSPEKKKIAPTQKDITFDEEDDVDIPRPKKLPSDVTILPYDPAEIEVLQSDAQYGANYVVRFFWNILYKVLSKETGVQCDNVVDYWGENLRILYWLITMSGKLSFDQLCIHNF